ncbi:glycosyltransferase [Algibacter sp.]|uniref:glycosyltransferase n=1 Tax=Algibacter sp. TaxID=1872428 RepID=UPI003C76E48C
MSLQKENQPTKEHILYLGESGFPYGLAATQRMILIAKSLLIENYKVTVLCRKGKLNKKNNPGFDVEGTFEGINYLYTSGNVFKPEGFLKRNISKIKGIIGEFKYLYRLKKANNITLAIISNHKVIHVLRYRLYASIIGFPVVLNFVEMRSSMQNRSSIGQRINDYFMDNYFVKMVDGAIPISDYLMAYYQKVSPKTPILKLPIISDFEKFELEKSNEEPYFLYCGSMAYRQVIDFIFEAYKNIPDNESAKLYMIVSGGSKKEVELLQQEVNNQFDVPKIKLFSNIPYEQLVYLYVNAIALLIPLRPTAQDTARFPHKIGEYLASGNPIITTKVGEIKNYFEDEKTALVADSYDVSAYAEKMEFVLKNPEKSKAIGLNGKALGLKEFDYKTQGSRLRKFLNQF